MRAGIKKGLKQALKCLGYDIHRIPRSGNKIEDVTTQSSGLLVEFVGPSGIGKSTTLSKVSPLLRDRWFFQEELYYNKSNGLLISNELEEAYKFLAEGKILEVMEQKAHTAEKVSRISFMLRLLRTDMDLIGQFYPRGFFLDDGICKNFVRQIVDGLQGNCHGIENLLRNRAYIFLLADSPLTIIENIKKRRNTTPWHFGNNFPGRSDSELMEICIQGDIENREFMSILSCMGCHILKLRAEDDFKVNSSKIFRFESVLLGLNKK